MRRFWLLALFAVSLPLPVACKGVETKAEYPTSRFPGDTDAAYGQRESIFGKDGLNLFGGKKDAKGTSTGVAVNAYLWRAALDTISFMPIASADPFGGTILTDWYESPNAVGERLKVNVFILDRSLRTDALRLSMFRQVEVGGQWQNGTVDPKTVTALEDAILTKARQLSVAANTK